MKIDIVQLAEIISALALIGGVVFGVFKFIENNKKQNAEIKGEQTLTMYALRACLDGLKQQGCNGRVTEAINKIDKYLNQSAHSAEDLN